MTIAAARAPAAWDVGHRETFPSMGTNATILVPVGREDAARVGRAVLAAWEDRFSRFDARSELAQLNASAGRSDGFAASSELAGVVSQAIEAAAATGGLFDPLLGARLVTLGYDRTFGELDNRTATARVPAWRPGTWRRVALNVATGRIHLPEGTAVDLGGIAKGMAVDAAIDAVVKAGASWAAVEAGGDLAVHGLPPGFRTWPIAVDGLGERTLAIADGALATSSVLERRWRASDGWRHHLLDPRTGMPARSGVALVTVAANTCAQAEVAAKAALLLGPSDGPAFLERHGLTGVFVADDGSEHWVVRA